MNLLGISTSSKQLSLGIWSEGQVIVDYNIHLGHRHNERLIPTLKNIMTEVDLAFADLSAVAVDIGPGSFTGLRIALASVKSFALVQEIEIVAISSLEIMTAGYLNHDDYILPLLDAGNNRVYTALFQGETETLPHKARQCKDLALSLTEIPQFIQDKVKNNSRVLAVGPAVKNYQQQLSAVSHGKFSLELFKAYQSQGWGGKLAELGSYYLQEDLTILPSELEPNYLKKPQAVLNRNKKQN